MNPRTLPVAAVQPNPANIRDQLGDLTELAESIRAKGILQPLLVAPTGTGTYRVLAGHRRLAAARQAGLRHVPCVVTAAPVDRLTAVELALIENCHRADLTPVEQARALKQLRDAGHTIPAIARKTGLSQATIGNRLVLLDLPGDAQRMIGRGDLGTTAAVELARQVRRDGTGQVTQARAPRHLTSTHPLARQALQLCEESAHPSRGRIGGVACGACWEQAIRQDERATMLGRPALGVVS